MLNIAIALAFIIATLFKPGQQLLELSIGLPVLETLPVGQAVLVKAIFDLWLPAFLIYVSLRTTRISEKFRPTNGEKVVLFIANSVLILYVCIRGWAYTIPGGGMSLVVGLAAPFTSIPALLIDGIVLIKILAKSSERTETSTIGFASTAQKIAVLTAGSIPIAYGIGMLTIGDASPFALAWRSHNRMDELCRTAGEKVVRVLSDVDGFYSDNVGGGLYLQIPGVGQMPVYRGKYQGYSLNSVIDDSDRYVKIGRIKYVEMPLRAKKGDEGPSGQYVRYRKDQEPEYVDNLISQVGVFRTKFTTEEDEKSGLIGYEVAIRILTTGEVTATSRYAFNKKTREFCGFVSNNSFYDSSFLNRAFGW